MRSVAPVWLVALAIGVLVLPAIVLPAPDRVGTLAAPEGVPPAATMTSPPPLVPHPMVAPSNATLAIWRQLCDGGSSCTSTQPVVKPAQFYDPVDDYVVSFGGGATNGASTQSTFIYQNGTWNQTFEVTIPGVRSNASAAWDTIDSEGILFGGWKASNSLYYQDTWKFQSGAWTLLSPNPHPGLRAGAMMVYIPAVNGHGGYVLLYGGKGTLASTNQLQSDTWKFVGGAWTNITSTAGTAPTARTEGGMAYDAVDNYVVLFGGYTAAGPVNSTYKFDPVTSQWSQLFANGSSTSGAGYKGVIAPEMAYDSNDHVVVETGGSTGSIRTAVSQVVIGQKITYTFAGGLWKNDSANVQTRSTAAGTTVPLPTYGGGFTDIPTAKFVVMVDGKNTVGVQNVSFAFGTQIAVNLTFNVGEVAIGASLNTVKIWANASVGSPPFSYVWTLPTGCSAGNVSSLSCTPTAAGVFTVQVNVSDTSGAWKLTAHRLVIDPSPSQTIVFSISSSNPVYLPSTFWALDYRCSPENNPGCISFVKQTPVHWFRVAGSMEGYNATTGQEFSRFGGFGSINWNWPNIISFCQQISPCHTVAAVPTQINYTATSVADMNYVGQNFSYHPDFWSLGNEPQGWVNFNHPFSSTPLPQPYTRLNSGNAYQVGIVENKVASALIAADPSTRVIAIQSAACGTSLFNTETAFYTWPDNSPVLACHAYPGGLSSVASTIADFLSTTNLTRTTTALLAERTGDAAICAQCNLPIWLTEFNDANTGSSYQNYMTQWPGVAFDAAEFVQFSGMNLSQFEYFYAACGGTPFAILTNSCGLTPVAGLYVNVFNHLHLGADYNVSNSQQLRGVYSVYTRDSTGTSMLIANTNTTVSAVVNAPNGFDSYTFNGVTAYSGDQVNGWQTSSYAQGKVATSWTIPPMGVLLLNANIAPAPPSPAPAIPGANTGIFSMDSNSGLFLFLLPAVGVGFLVAVAVVAWPAKKGRRGI